MKTHVNLKMTISLKWLNLATIPVSLFNTPISSLSDLKQTCFKLRQSYTQNFFAMLSTAKITYKFFF